MTAAIHDPLRRELLAAVARRRRRGRRALAAAGALTAVAAAVSILSLTAREPAAALAVERTDEWISLRIQDAGAGAERMTEELREAGIQGKVIVVPAEPPLAGRWIGAIEVPDAEPANPDGSYAVRLREVEIDDATVRVPSDFSARPQDGDLIFYAGRPARPEEVALRALPAQLDQLPGLPRPPERLSAP